MDVYLSDLKSSNLEKEPFWKKKIPFVLALAIIMVLSGATVTAVFWQAKKVESRVEVVKIPKRVVVHEILPEAPPEWKFNPGPISMDKVRKKGCVADGILNNYGDCSNDMDNLIERSECYYLHRALETWKDPPDFEKAKKIMSRIDNDPIVYGMFLAEALDRKAEYYYAHEDRNFDFGDMCKNGTENHWDDHICIPDLESREYQKYIIYITKQAMDLGIQSFLFGQIYLTENDDLSKSEIPEIIFAMRTYAKAKKMDIIIGAQTNAITDKKYLSNFDYIEGGVGIDGEGNVENGPCWSDKESCWALLWHENYSSVAKNVILNLDWSGLSYDDMSKFSRMDQETRIKTLEKLHAKFTKGNLGFMMPFLATIHKEGSVCHGPTRRFYSPDDKYSCNDEDEINAIIKKR